MNAWWRGLALVATTGALLAMTAASGCGDSRKNEDDGGGTPPPDTTSASELNLEILSADVPAGAAPFVRFKATDAAGRPIDLAAEIQAQATTPATATRLRPRFTLAQLEDDGDYVSYYETTATGAQGSATQAVGDPTTSAPFPLDRLTAEGNGVYRYTFSAPTKTGLDRAKTHTVAMWATRTVVASGTTPEKQWPAAATYSFVPGGVGTVEKLETVTDAACNTCHGVLAAHDNRTKTQLCMTCHSPQSVDPDTGNTVDFKVMVHKIHRGANLPSVRSGSPYRIVGFQGSVHDYSEVGFPRDIRECTACHQGEDADNWKTRASLAACTSCHDNVRFDGTAAAPCTPGGVTAPGGSDPCNHVANVQQTFDCAACHSAAAVEGKHVSINALAAAYRTEVTAITADASGTTVTYRVFDPGTNAPYGLDIAKQLNVMVGWQQPEFTNEGSGSAAPAQPLRLAGTGATEVAGTPGTFQVTSTTPVPDAVKSVRAWVEGHPVVSGVTLPVVNSFKDLAVHGGAVAARRQVVDTNRCNACHGVVSAHGQNRNGAVEVCLVCHNPRATDLARSSQIAGAPEQTIDFKVLIHAVHGADVRSEDSFQVYGFGTPPSLHTFPAHFPGSTASCNVCHTGTTFALPLAAEVLDPAIRTAGAQVTVPRTQAVCTSCHDTVRFDGSAAAACGPGVEGPCNHTGGANLPDASCATCHGPGTLADVAKVHPVSAQ